MLFKITMLQRILTKKDKSPDDRDVDFNGFWTVEYTGKHGDALFGEGKGKVFTMLASS